MLHTVQVSPCIVLSVPWRPAVASLGIRLADCEDMRLAECHRIGVLRNRTVSGAGSGASPYAAILASMAASPLGNAEGSGAVVTITQATLRLASCSLAA